MRDLMAVKAHLFIPITDKVGDMSSILKQISEKCKGLVKVYTVRKKDLKCSKVIESFHAAGIQRLPALVMVNPSGRIYEGRKDIKRAIDDLISSLLPPPPPKSEKRAISESVDSDEMNNQIARRLKNYFGKPKGGGMPRKYQSSIAGSVTSNGNRDIAGGSRDSDSVMDQYRNMDPYLDEL